MESVKGLISIARKAGFAIIGQDNLKNYDKKLFLILIDKAAGASLLREMEFLSKQKNIPLLQVINLGEMVSIKNCKTLGIKNKALSENIIKCLKGD